jgi:voltage-gated sodium channel
MLYLIVINGIVITLSYFPAFEHNFLVNAIDRLITSLFVIEVIAKLSRYGFSGYFSDGWNRFDFSLTAVGVPSLLQGIVPVPDMSFWLVLRLLRLTRLIKLIKFIPHIDQLLRGVLRAIRASILVLGTLAFVNYILAMLTCHFLGNVSPGLFGDPFKSMYTMFQVFTIEGWNEIPAQVVSDIEEASDGNGFVPLYFTSAVVQVFFATVLLFVGIMGLSLANAIFVDEMTMDNNDSIEVKIDALQRSVTRILGAIDTTSVSSSTDDSSTVDPRVE